MKSVVNSAFDLDDSCDISLEEFSTAFGYLDVQEADDAVTGMLQSFRDYKKKLPVKTELVENFLSTLKKLGDLSVTFANEKAILEKQHKPSEEKPRTIILKQRSSNRSSASVAPDPTL